MPSGNGFCSEYVPVSPADGVMSPSSERVYPVVWLKPSVWPACVAVRW